jgi:AbrB family looped-hinge helix DNA binding protein
MAVAIDWERVGSVFPMKSKVDDVGRIVVPKAMRERLGLTPGSIVDISLYGDGLHVSPGGRTARLERRGDHLVAVADTEVSDDDVFDIIDSVRR